ncbi:MAG: hypothetical protein HY540_07250 [Deltaproteobacteria bacterium]|nr:hypothetical protein [Deltaproteobacteria bacterium]
MGSNGSTATAPTTMLRRDLDQFTKAVRDLATDSVEYLQDNLTEGYQKGTYAVRQAEQSIEGQIKKYPVQALLIAAGIGVVASLLVRRK